MAAKILRQPQDPPGRPARGPPRLVVYKNARIGQAKTVDALLDIPHQKAVGLLPLARQGLDDGFLRAVNVLEFIHKNEAQFPPPWQGDLAGAFLVPQQAQGELLQVLKIHAAGVALGQGESGVETPGGLQQRQHGRARPIPVFRQRVRPVRQGANRLQKIRLVKKILDGIAPPAFGFGPGLVNLANARQRGGEFRARGV